MSPPVDPALDAHYMARALELGARVAGATWPNPAVGCVIVADAAVVGEGATQLSGRPHAEVMALTEAGARARGATAYVTLEPCAHYGRTPPCAEALVAAGVARVVYAVGDPDPRVAGKGAAILRAAGVAVESGVLEDAAARAHAGFFSRIQAGRPHLTLKLATSFDGRIATATGESQWITGPQARQAVHRERARHDAVLVGAGTARTDDPTLTARDVEVLRQPVRVVTSRRLDLPLNSNLARTAQEVPVWLCHGEDADRDRIEAWTERGALCVPVPLAGRQLDLAAVFQALGTQGLTTVFCEGGGALAASLLDAGLVDRLIGYTAGLLLGAEGQPAIGALGLDALKDAPRFRLEAVRPLGDDIEHIWRRSSP